MKKRTFSNQVILPGEYAWELWRAPHAAAATGSSYTVVSKFEEGMPAFENVGGAKTFSIPSAELTVVPLWIQVPHADTEEAVEMQLEGRGLHAPHGACGWKDYKITRDEGGRRLAVVTVLSGAKLAIKDKSPLPDSMRASADFLPVRRNRVTIFRELGELVVAVTQGTEVVFQMPLVAQEAGDDAGREIVQIVFQLQFDGVVGSVDGLDVWVDAVDVEALSKRTGLQVEVSDRPSPVVPGAPAGNLETPDIARLREAERSSIRVKKIAVGAGALFALAVFASVLVSVLLGWKRDALLKEIAELTPRASSVAVDESRWKEISPALDRDGFVLEKMRQLGEVPSVRGVTLTQFEVAPGSVTVTGRANGPGQALKFGGEVTGGGYLPDFRWEFPPPSIAGDNTATFELKGTRGGNDGA